MPLTLRRRNNSPSESSAPSTRRSSISFPNIFTFKSHSSNSTSSSRSPSPSRVTSATSSTSSTSSASSTQPKAAQHQDQEQELRNDASGLKQDLTDAETWERMLDMQMEYHCYNSARLEAAVEARLCGVKAEEIARPSRLCLDLLNDELRSTMQNEWRGEDGSS